MGPTNVMDNLSVYVQDQLPAGIRDRLSVSVTSDAYCLTARATFRDEQGRDWVCSLDRITINGKVVAMKIPDAVLAHLAVVVT